MNELDPSVLLNYGFGGLIVILILTKQIVPGWIYRHQQEEIVDLNAQVKRLQDVQETRVLPALYKSNEILDKLVHEEVRLPHRAGGG